MAKQSSFNDFLSDEGLIVFKSLKKHCDSLKMMEADDFELSMLANSFSMYADAAKFCKLNGTTHTMQTKTGPYEMIRPEYQVMKNEYQNILKHSSKFGLNPGDREKIFKGIKEKKAPDFAE